jgi:hypothetical protein
MKKARKKKSTAKKAKKSAKAKVKKSTKVKAKKPAKAKVKKPAKVKAKKPATAKAKTPAKAKPTSATTTQGQVSGGLVDKQPQDKEQAAVAHEMFLFVDDAWAQRYFDQNDLHFLEREVFG